MILMNDRLVADSEARVSVKDRGYNFGDGVYEVFRMYNGVLFEKDAHLTRLERSAQETRIALPCSIAELESRLARLVEACGVADGTLYMQITRGTAERAHPFPAIAEPMLTAWCTEIRRPIEAMQAGISAITKEDIRWHRCDIKTLNLLPNVLAKQEALDRGATDAILHRSGTVTETTSANVMIVADGAIYTHPLDNHILHGVTRAVVKQLCGKLEIPFHDRAFTLEDLRGSDEVFITGTTVEVTPVTVIDQRPVGQTGEPGPITRRLQQAFERYARVNE